MKQNIQAVLSRLFILTMIIALIFDVVMFNSMDFDDPSSSSVLVIMYLISGVFAISPLLISWLIFGKD